ncbi:MAG: ATP-binding cassette domain-containing protein [Streptosporangiales bacterium]|nr:ATP-binding cassette domain-containing protein [Streptosporangiales bacterium]
MTSPFSVPRGLLLTESPNQERMFRRSLPYLRENGGLIALACVVACASAASLAFIPPAIGFAVDELLAGSERGLLVATLTIIGLALARLALQVGAEAMLPHVGELVLQRLRDRVVQRLASAPLRFIEAHRSGDLLRRATAELADLGAFNRNHLSTMVTTVGYLAITSVVLLVYSWPLAIVLLLTYVPLHLVFAYVAGKTNRPASADEASAASDVASHFRELLDIREQLQMHGGGEKWLGRLTTATRAQQDATLRTQTGLNLLSGTQVVQAVTLGALLVAGTLLVARDATTIGTVVIFVVAARQMFSSLTQLSNLGSQALGARVVLARLLNLLHRTRPKPVATGYVSTPRRGSLATKDLSFAYVPGHEVIEDVTVTLPVGDRVGVYGETGSGKTTLAKLFTGLYAPSEGTVTYAGTDLRYIDPDELRQRIVLVPQEVHLVSGTLLENISLIPTRPTRAEVEAGITALDLNIWVSELPDGLDTDIGPRGERLSAGERQLIGLVRAALVDAAVLIFDEATANLDLLTAEHVESAVRRLAPDRTVVVIAHRQETVERLARPMQLRAGRLGPGPPPGEEVEFPPFPYADYT